MNEQTLTTTTHELLVPGKGILAADESSHTADKRFNQVGVEPSQENRRRYRQLLLTTPGIEQYLSGVIFYDETLRQQTDDGVPFTEYLQQRHILAGIKTDQGLVALNDTQEQVSQGLDGLEARSQEYFELGARFAKWRSVIQIGPNMPSQQAITANAEVLASYAKISQDCGLVPIIEPEVLLSGQHDLKTSQSVLTQTLDIVFKSLATNRVELRFTVLKTSMATPGLDSGQTASSQAIAQATAEALRASVPAEVPGVVFLSGGQTPAQATANLNAIAQLGPYPWLVTFSYSRALQDPVLNYWAKYPDDITAAQTIFAKRVELAALAQAGKYSAELETNQAGQLTAAESQD